MANFSKSEIIKNIILGTLIVSGRRTLKSYAIKVVKTVLGIIEQEFDFLKYVEIKDINYIEGEETVNVSSMINSIDSTEFGKAIEVFLKNIYTELKDQGGLYFISELKEYLGENYISELGNLGINLDKVQSEQHEFFNKLEKEKTEKSKNLLLDKQNKKKKKIELKYNWGDISNWEYKNNVVSLYKSNGELLDKIQLDVLIEDYVSSHSIVHEPDLAENMLNITEKELEFLKMINSRDIDIEFAKNLLHISKEELENIIQKLLEFEMLSHISSNELKITEKGINYLIENK
jgi:hypothetical protein